MITHGIKFRIVFILLIVSVSLLSSCDIACSFYCYNSNAPEYNIKSNSCDVIVEGHLFQGDAYILFKSNEELVVDEKKVCFSSNDPTFKYNVIRVTYEKHDISKINNYKNWYRLRLAYTISPNKDSFIQIPPSEMVTCNGVPVVTDTISFYINKLAKDFKD